MGCDRADVPADAGTDDPEPVVVGVIENNHSSQHERLKKLKVLAERGIGGEKENAGALLRDYHPQIIYPERKMQWFRHKKTPHFRKLLLQCMYKTLGKGQKKYTHGRVSEIGVECTAAEAIEIDLDYSFYSDALEVEIERFIEMFVQKNDIFPQNCEGSTDGSPKLTIEDFRLYQGIKKHTRILQIRGEIP